MSNLKALSKTIVVELENGEKVEVSKLPLGQYAKLMFTLQKMPNSIISDLQNIDTNDNDKAMQALFGIFAQAWGQVLDILSIGTGLDRERIENDPVIGLDGGVELFIAVFKVNNLNGVVTKAKNLLAGSLAK